ncbi:MAG: gliding motility-associated C-terminal domain-containing protein, partial [Mucilaginibacter sp.]
DPITVTINVYTAKMSLTKVANNGANKVGDIINYTLIVTNTGTSTLTNVVVTDAGVDAGLISPASTASLAPGASATYTAQHTVIAADVTAGFYSNQASVTAKDPKNNTVTNPKSDDPGTTTPDDPTIVPIINLGVPSIGVAKAGVFAGNKITYTFTITNTGNVNLDNITLTDTKLGLAAVSITAPTGGLVPAGKLTYTSTYTLTQADKDAGTVNNTATASGTDPNNTTVTGTGSAVTTVTKSPVAVDDTDDATAGTPLVVTPLANDNPGTSTFQLNTIEIISNPTHGTAVSNANGTVTYTSTAGYSGTDVFTYRVKDADGYYTNIATVTIKVTPALIKIPSLFTPNGDGVNDGFVIKDLADYAQNELIVLNRWGNEVYRAENYQNNWSGTGLNEGTYFYIVRLKKANGDSWVIQKGYVTLIRQFKK